MMQEDGFKYYAFISYSHKDQATAKKLQARLESYHLPAKILKSHPGLPKKLTPVFMDESNLVAAGTLKAALQENLDKSNYLIVICSPNSAKSEYVNEEVEYFIKSGRADKIIPLIIDGVPHSDDKETECFAPAILNLPRDQELLGIDLKKFGTREAFLRVIATLLKLDLDAFVSREAKIRRKRIFALAAAAALIVIISGIFAWRSIRLADSEAAYFEQTLRDAEAGNAEAQFNLSNSYFSGKHRDMEKATQWLIKAAEQGHAEAQFSLATSYTTGLGVKLDEAEAAKWYLKAAEQGHAFAQHSIGGAYAFGNGVRQDKAEAAKWYRKSAEQGFNLAQHYLGMAYIYGDGVEQNYAEAVKWLEQAVRSGYDNAAPDLNFAVKCLSADQDNNAEAQFEIGAKYEDEYKYNDAAKWYLKAAEQGHVKAQARLGYIMYSGGFGIERNYSEAFKWRLKAAEQGDLKSQKDIAHMYYVGNGTDSNKSEAIKWWSKAAEQGDAEAQRQLDKFNKIN